MADDGDSTSLNRPRGVPAATVEQLVERIATAPNRPAQHRLLADLVRVAVASGQILPAAYSLGESPADGVRLAVEFLYLLPERLPPAIAGPAPRWLAATTVPVPVRLGVAAKILASIPDTAKDVGPIIKAVLDALPESRALERMMQLQALVEKSDSLDALVIATESKLKFNCPRCPAVLPRREFVAHLWTKHRLVYDGGRATDPSPILDAEVTAAANSPLASDRDRAFLQTAFYYPDVPSAHVFQALASRGPSDPMQTDQLLERARQDEAGLCPVCLSAVPDPIPPLPPEAAVAPGHIDAEGFCVDVTPTPFGREVRITEPDAAAVLFGDTTRATPPRLMAVIVASGVLLFLLVVSFFLPRTLVSPLVVSGGVVLLGWLAYVAVLVTRKAAPNRTTKAVDYAWTRLVPGIGRTPTAMRFLTRLCRASVGVGGVATRRKSLYELVEQSAVLSDKSVQHAQLFAAARVLEVLDDARVGKERVSVLIELFEPFLRGEASPAYIEAVSELVLASGTLTSGDARRLGIAVIVAGFETGFGPLDLLTITRFCPWFRRVVLGSRLEFVSLLHAIWKTRNARPWSSVGEAITVMALVREDPTEGRRLLADHPDLLLKIELDETVEEELGVVVLTANGLVIGDALVNDPTTAIMQGRNAENEWVLSLGTHRIALHDKIPSRVVEEFRGWVAFWYEKLLPTAEQSTRRSLSERTGAVLAPLVVECPLCRSQCLHRAGQIGTPWQAIAPR